MSMNISIFLMAFAVSLESQVTYPLAAFAVSSFKHHSLLSTVYVVQGVVNGENAPVSLPDRSRCSLVACALFGSCTDPRGALQP